MTEPPTPGRGRRPGRADPARPGGVRRPNPRL